ncbi:MAG: formate/nitrite transporter family protein [Clostridiales bacterium]|nr:formate/nitrite transporter family protein [Clostridiales bacterium]
MNSPAEIAKNYLSTGESKCKNAVSKMIVLAIFAGMFIAIAGVGATAAAVSIKTASVAKLVSGLIFPTGLAMVLVAGSELFTGNNLIIISVLEKRVSVGAMLKNWFFVYIGNFIGSLIIALFAVYGGVFKMFGNELASSAVAIANAKVSMPFFDALIKGILCNFLVCIAVWMSFGAKTVSGKIIGLFLPIMLFILSGYEHSVANMYYIPAGLFSLSQFGIESEVLNWGSFFIKNLIPVTLGNIIGGCGIVGCGYWFAYLRTCKDVPAAPERVPAGKN